MTDVEPITWTRQQRQLWTGRRADKPAGTIERGRRFVFFDLDGVASTGFASLREAQAAAEAARIN